MARTVYERDLDALFLRNLRRHDFASAFLREIGEAEQIHEIFSQSRHAEHGGTIDLEVRLTSGAILLVENKIDAGYSITRDGEAQPQRYAASVAAFARRGVRAHSVLLAPEKYLSVIRAASLFDRLVSYEALRSVLEGADLRLLEAAIAQAEEPYEPDPNAASADFFRDFEAFAQSGWPELVIKRNPNGGGVRPTGSHTIYFDVKKTLRIFSGSRTPRMSLQCRDSGAPSASVKIMLPGLAGVAGRFQAPNTLSEISGYLRPAGRSLACVIDTPHLNTQLSVADQIDAIQTALEAADRLRRWWKRDGGTFLATLEKCIG